MTARATHVAIIQQSNAFTTVEPGYCETLAALKILSNAFVWLMSRLALRNTLSDLRDRGQVNTQEGDKELQGQ